MHKGDILFHKRFGFKDGHTSPKLIVILNTPNLDKKEPYLVCRTTSKQGIKIKSPACDTLLSTFFIPADEEYFETDTWLQLHELFEIEAQSLLQDHFNQELFSQNELSENKIRQLVNCIKKNKDISQEHKDLIFNS